MTKHEAISCTDTDLSGALTPHDKLMAAIGILQTKSMAEDSMRDGQNSWGPFFMPGQSIDHAIHLLIDLLPHLENWPNGENS